MDRTDRLPQFLDQRWADGSRLSRDAALDVNGWLPGVVAAQWLYVPDFVEYRGGVFRTEEVDRPDDDLWTALDRMIATPGWGLQGAEFFFNRFLVFDAFANTDIDPYRDAFADWMQSLAASWRALLAQRFPRRTFEFMIEDGDDETFYGPQVSFWQPRSTHEDQS